VTSATVHTPPVAVADSDTASPPDAVVEGASAVSSAADAPPETTEALCANCETLQPCVFDGETYICPDAEACRERGSAAAAMSLPDGDSNEDDPELVEEDASDEETDAAEWVKQLQERISTYAAGEEPSYTARQQELGKVLSAASGGNTVVSRRLLELLTGNAVHRRG
jgi:hypothetical protein